jgi:hypothetical protein
VADVLPDETVSVPRRIDCWKCSDGRIFERESWAIDWQRDLDNTAKANEALETGESVGECLVIRGTKREYVPEVLFKITRNSGIVIRHWQGQEKAGYKVCEFKPNGDVFVFGHAGCWSGAYGCDISVRDLARYVESTLEGASHVQ